MNSFLALEALPLAKELDENKVTPGVLGFVVFAVLGIGVWFLLKSMNRHLGKVDFKETQAGGPASTANKANTANTANKASNAEGAEGAGG